MSLSLNNHQQERRMSRKKEIPRPMSGCPTVPGTTRPGARARHGNEYNPSHPEADWSGFVPAKVCKKQFSSGSKVPPALKVQVTTLSGDSNENGNNVLNERSSASCAPSFGPKKDAATNEWSKPGRRMSIASSPQLKGGRSSTFSLIGGPSPISSSSGECHSCSEGSRVGSKGAVSASHWETESQSMSNRKKTTIDQMTERGRSVHIRGRRATAPPYIAMNEKDDGSGGSCNEGRRKVVRRGFDSQRAHVIRNENPYSLNDVKAGGGDVKEHSKTSGCNNEGRRSDNLIGYRAKPLTSSSNQSFLSNLAKDLPMTKSMTWNNGRKKQEQQKHHYVSVAPFATDGNLPTDPYERRCSSSSGSRGGGGRMSKDLLRENYSSQVPGYTGKRTFS